MTEPTITIDTAHGLRTDADGWEHYAYTVTLAYDGRTLAGVPWMHGTGIQGPPEAHDVIGSLLMEAAGVENCSGFHDWAQEYGYDYEDDPEAEARYRATFEQVKQHTDGLSELLTRPLMVALMDDEDSTYGSAERFSAAWTRATAAAAR